MCKKALVVLDTPIYYGLIIDGRVDIPLDSGCPFLKRLSRFFTSLQKVITALIEVLLGIVASKMKLLYTCSKICWWSSSTATSLLCSSKFDPFALL